MKTRNEEPGTICELRFTREADGIRVVLEQFEADYVMDDEAAIVTVELGTYSEDAFDGFYHALSLKADGYRSELTPAFIEELKALIQEHL